MGKLELKLIMNNMRNKERVISYIGIGSNLGDRQDNIDKALSMLREIEGIEVCKISQIYETLPVGGPAQPDFLNAVVSIKTSLDAHSLLRQLQAIENKLGRVRTVKNGPRTLDLDILTYGEQKINTADLTVPHPLMYDRDFVMKPLKDIHS